MKGLKIGDRVRVDVCNGEQSHHRGAVGVVFRLFPDKTHVRLASGVVCVGTAVSLMASPDPYQPRDGDEITMSLRGVVHDDGNHGWVVQGDMNMSLEDFEGYEVEVHKRAPEKPKLPTTPGSIIKYDGNPNTFFLNNEGWRYLTKKGRTGGTHIDRWSDEITVIYDAADAPASS